jgi:adenylosuccinate lyase
VEVRWLQALIDSEEVPELAAVSKEAEGYLNSIAEDFSLADAARVKEIEATTNHDVKAIEYLIKEKLEGHAEFQQALEFVHFACTSEDINNLAYALMLKAGLNEVVLPEMHEVAGKLREHAWQRIRQCSSENAAPDCRAGEG